MLPLATTLWLLVCMHALCDYPLQGDFLAKFKSPSAPLINGEVVWPIVLSAHAAIHAGGVFVVTQSLTLSLAEYVAHTAIDYGKCRGWFGFGADQALHIGCKVIWVSALWAGLA